MDFNGRENDIPEHRANGCLPRTTKPGDVFKLMAKAEDPVPLIARSERPKYYGISLRPRVWSIQDQGQIGSCASEACVQGLKLVREVSNFERVDLQPYSLYARVNDGRDGGSDVERNLKEIQLRGVLPTAMWSRDLGWNHKFPANWEEYARPYRGVEAFDLVNLDEFASCLAAGLPVVTGVRWGRGAHAICFVGLKPDGLEFVNSWGLDYEDHGFGVLDERTVAAGIEVYGAYALRSAVYA